MSEGNNNGNNGNGDNGSRNMWFQIGGTVIAALILAGLAFVYNGITDLQDDFNNLRTEIVKMQTDMTHLVDDFQEHKNSEAHAEAITRINQLTTRIDNMNRRFVENNLNRRSNED